MGLLKAAIGSIGGVAADQWKEFFTCSALDKNTLMVRGQKQEDRRSSNTKGNNNVITNGSGVAVADGQCLIIVEQGRIIELCAEPGVYTYNSQIAPSVFCGSFGESLKQTFRDIGTRFQYGGASGRDQRVYYINTKEIMENMFGTANPIPFRVVDRNIALDIDVSVRCSGVYSYKITNPILFYTNVCANVQTEFTRSEIDKQLKTEFINALQPALARISELEVRPNAIPAHAVELSNAMNEILTKQWSELRGISVISVAMNPIVLPEEDAELIKQAQRTAIMRDPNMAAATLVGAQADAMKTAAGNQGGAMNGFIGMGMAMNQGGMNAQNLFAMGQQQQSQPAPVMPQQPATQANTWECECGATNTGKFCSTCGKPAQQQMPQLGWTCSCGAVNQGKFCQECGKPKLAGTPLYRCDKCGWQPEDPTHPPKFCPECGDPFNKNDLI